LLERAPQSLLTPRVARAMTSPSAILLAGAGAAVAIVGGLPILAAAGVGAAAWAARVALAVPRRAKGERIDPYALKDPWRQYVREAQSAQARYARAVGTADPGPLRQRLEEIGARIDTGVREAWRVAKRGAALEGALLSLDIPRTRQELAQVERDAGQPWASGTSLEQTAAALRAQLQSAERMQRVAQNAHERLRLLDARLDEAVARAVELALRSGDSADVGGLGSDVDQLVGDMEALRAALDDVGAAEAGGRPQAGTA
jgi:hypothetical protein